MATSALTISEKKQDYYCLLFGEFCRSSMMWLQFRTLLLARDLVVTADDENSRRWAVLNWDEEQYSSTTLKKLGLQLPAECGVGFRNS